MPEGERDRLERYGEFAPVGTGGRAYTPDHLLAGGETIEIAGLTFECVAVPGHSPAHVAYYTEGCLFSGDLLFAGSVGRVDLPGGDWDTLLESVRSVADRFPAETVVYPGHGPQTTLGEELARNPFLAELRA
jgi:glyoxylase-like metal-dependent hydrolase (beta-lactamase superfamily II)